MSYATEIFSIELYLAGFVHMGFLGVTGSRDLNNEMNWDQGLLD